MQVKIGKNIYDSESEPVMVILSKVDRENIASMPSEATMYASFPDSWGSTDEMKAWMTTADGLVS